MFYLRTNCLHKFDISRWFPCPFKRKKISYPLFVLLLYHCYNRLPQIQWVKQGKFIIFNTSLKRQKSRCWQSCILSRGSRRECFHAHSGCCLISVLRGCRTACMFLLATSCRPFPAFRNHYILWPIAPFLNFQSQTELASGVLSTQHLFGSSSIITSLFEDTQEWLCTFKDSCEFTGPPI